MNKKGFTLVELLAILGLLTIIVLLGAPILINQIDSSKKKIMKILWVIFV